MTRAGSSVELVAAVEQQDDDTGGPSPRAAITSRVPSRLAQNVISVRVGMRVGPVA